MERRQDVIGFTQIGSPLIFGQLQGDLKELLDLGFHRVSLSHLAFRITSGGIAAVARVPRFEPNTFRSIPPSNYRPQALSSLPAPARSPSPTLSPVPRRTDRRR